jgi:hypothetical protein
MGFKAMNHAKMRMALDKRDFLEQLGFNEFQFGPSLMKICVSKILGL